MASRHEWKGEKPMVQEAIEAGGLDPATARLFREVAESIAESDMRFEDEAALMAKLGSILGKPGLEAPSRAGLVGRVDWLLVQLGHRSWSGYHGAC